MSLPRIITPRVLLALFATASLASAGQGSGTPFAVKRRPPATHVASPSVPPGVPPG